VSARKKLTETEKELSQVIFETTGGNQDFALICCKGDQALFGKSTQAMKSTWNVPEGHLKCQFCISSHCV
jgi:DNA-damage-inducible protein D